MQYREYTQKHLCLRFFKDTAHNMTLSCEQQVEVQASTEVAPVNNNLSSFALSIPVGVPENIWKTIWWNGLFQQYSVKNYVGI